MTIDEAYRDGVSRLLESGEDDSESRAVVRQLLEHVAGIRHAHLLHPDRALENEQLQQFEAYLTQVLAGRPLRYILGTCEFFGLNFACDENVLIPRPETELLVELAVARLKDKASPVVADLGTGSGCIAISVAHAVSQANVYATDASSGALKRAAENAALNGVENRIQFITCDSEHWAQPLLHAGLAGKLDGLLSNPPYIASAEIETLQTQVRDWEPRSALDGGPDGLDCYRALAAQTAILMTPGGFTAVELGAGQFGTVAALYREQGWQVDPAVLDYAGIERILVASRPG